MKTIKCSLIVISFFLFPFSLTAQTNFNLDLYKTFLQAHQNLSSDGLMQMYPAGKFIGNLNLNYNSAQYFDSISAKYGLTGAEISAIQQNGFMVSERLSRAAFGQALIEIYQNDLPVFISTDAILHALHMSYDRILNDIEIDVIIDSLKSLLTRMHSNIYALNAKYSSNSQMIQMLEDVDVYTTVAGELLNLPVIPYYAENSSKINQVISLITAASGASNYSLFSTEPVLYDWSQFEPRGHYVNPSYPILANYFRTMMWLGRIEIYLLMPDAFNTASKETQYLDIQRETIDAMLIKELFDTSQVSTTYEYIENILEYFVGEQDNVTIDNLGYLKNAVNLSSSADLLDSLKLITFQDTLKNQTFANQLILSQLLAHNPLSPDSVVPASSFLLFGQRFVIDSYITSQVVYDKTPTCRLMPSMLDPMFALGNNASAQLLNSELEKYLYSKNLAALRYLIDSYGADFWQSSMYNLWLNSIRSLNPPIVKDSLPLFMQTGAYWQEKLNTQLSSWTELRHDNLLYAKESYTTGFPTCSYPFTYIEPFPEFYRNLQIIAQEGQEKFNKLSVPSLYGFTITNYFNYLYNICDTLISISLKELDNIPFSSAEINFLSGVLFSQTEGCSGITYDGWYPGMYYYSLLFSSNDLTTEDNIVADVHTVNTDCHGNFLGWVKEVGTGPVNLGVFAAQLPGGKLTAFIGPVSSYYEYTTENNLQRLTDDEWKDTYLASSLRPSWVNLYLLDNNGNAQPEGLNLITAVNNPVKPVNEVTGCNLYIRNFPNPFNPATTISFQVPAQLTNKYVELTIYNIQGMIVKRLIHENLQGGNYLTRWNATNDAGNRVASGTYICNLKVGNMQKANKILLLK
jgi:hypothetical protein